MEDQAECVIDVNVILDLQTGSLVENLFGLPFKFVVSDFVMYELRRVVANLSAMRLEIHELSSEQVRELYAQIEVFRDSLHLSDRASLLLAKYLGAILLSGDKDIREVAMEMGIEIHGTYWVMDQMVDSGLLAPLDAIARLKHIRLPENGRRLPEKEAVDLIAKWTQIHQERCKRDKDGKNG